MAMLCAPVVPRRRLAAALLFPPPITPVVVGVGVVVGRSVAARTVPLLCFLLGSLFAREPRRLEREGARARHEAGSEMVDDVRLGGGGDSREDGVGDWRVSHALDVSQRHVEEQPLVTLHRLEGSRGSLVRQREYALQEAVVRVGVEALGLRTSATDGAVVDVGAVSTREMFSTPGNMSWWVARFPAPC